MNIKYYAIIVAGGSGTRMGGSVAKQFVQLEEKLVIEHTINRFLSMDNVPEIILVLNPAYIDFWKEYCFKKALHFRHTIVPGGITRYHSVKEALRYIKQEGVVAIHDSVRPFIKTEFLNSIYDQASQSGAVIPYLSPVDSMRKKDQKLSIDDSKVVNRDDYIMIQTPQVFKTEILLKSYEKPYDTKYTDDASVVEDSGFQLSYTPGDPMNIKLTRPEDLIMARAILSVF